MTLLEFMNLLPSKEHQEELAASCKTSLSYLRLVALGHKRASISLAIAVSRLSNYAVTLESLRPDIEWNQWHTDIGAAINKEAA